MIVLLSSTAILLAGLQAGINAPRAAFTDCLKEASKKATAEKVPVDGFGAYLKTNCSSQSDAFKAASVKFDVKNGISRKEAASAADDMIGGWLESSVENYSFRMAEEGPAPKQAAAPAQAQATAQPQKAAAPAEPEAKQPQ
jgi:hypothetical protein